MQDYLGIAVDIKLTFTIPYFTAYPANLNTVAVTLAGHAVDFVWSNSHTVYILKVFIFFRFNPYTVHTN